MRQTQEQRTKLKPKNEQRTRSFDSNTDELCDTFLTSWGVVSQRVVRQLVEHGRPLFIEEDLVQQVQ